MTEVKMTNDLQALISGVIYAALLQATDLIALELSPERDVEGDMLPRLHVIGCKSGTHLLVSIEVYE
jgi:hypothetical protein